MGRGGALDHRGQPEGIEGRLGGDLGGRARPSGFLGDRHQGESENRKVSGNMILVNRNTAFTTSCINCIGSSNKVIVTARIPPPALVMQDV